MAHETNYDDYEAAMTATHTEDLENAPTPYVQPPPVILPSYVLVSKAGRGEYASAYFCLPKRGVKAIRSRRAEVTSQA